MLGQAAKGPAQNVSRSRMFVKFKALLLSRTLPIKSLFPVALFEGCVTQLH